MTLQYVCVFAVIDDEDQAGLARTIESIETEPVDDEAALMPWR